MEIKTNDGYIIQKNSKIRYTGDMANTEGIFEVVSIEPSEWYRCKIILQEIGEDNRNMTLYPSSFDRGPGRRFIPFELWEKQRKEAIEKMRGA